MYISRFDAFPPPSCEIQGSPGQEPLRGPGQAKDTTTAATSTNHATECDLRE